MRKEIAFLTVALVLASLVPATGLVSAAYGQKIIDGSLSDWTNSDLIAIGKDNGQAGANLDRLYVSWDDQYLYIAIKTNNTANWGVAYGIGIDVDPGTGDGYTTGGDAWGRSVEFTGGYAIDYELYTWWDNSQAKPTVGGSEDVAFIPWTGGAWSYQLLRDVGGDFAYTGDSSVGLQVLELKIPWTALGGRPERIAIITWVTGGSGSAVDSLPVDPAINYSDIGSEWGDTDTFTNLAEIYVGTKTIDGDLSDWSGNELAAKDTTGVGVDGGNLSKLYVSWDDQYLYIAIEANNSANWGMAYGIGIDIDPGTGNGYTGGGDAWGRNINFSNGYAIDYELYTWWDNSQAKPTVGGSEDVAFIPWTGGSWQYEDVGAVGGSYAYTGDSSKGLRTLEIAIPWSALGGKPKHFAVAAWVTGGSGSAVDILPQEAAANDNADEWNDVDVVTQMSEFWMFIPVPELTVSMSGPSVVGINRNAVYNVTVENKGSLPAQNASVRAYINGTLAANWSVDLNPGESRWFTFNWTPNATGTYTIRAVVDEENAIPEANENNNEVTMNVDVIWVGNIDVDGNPSDWTITQGSPNTLKVENGIALWTDAVGDQRTDKDPYLPGGTSSHADLTKVGVTKDDRYVYFLFEFANMSNIKIGDNGATFVAVPIDYKEGGATWFAGEMDTNSVIQWDTQMVINLCSDQYVGQREAVTTAGNSKRSLLYFVDPNGNIITVNDALIGVNLDKNTIEVRVPVSVFGGATTFNFQVATGFSYGDAVWNFGNPFANDGVSDIVDLITTEPTTAGELSDNVPDYYIHVTMNNVIERASLVSVKIQRLISYQNTFVMINKFYGIRDFQRDYASYTALVKELSNMPLTEDMKKKLEESQSQATEFLKLYNEGKSLIDMPNYAFGASLKIYRAYTGLKKVIGELEGMLATAQSGELEKQREMEELAKNLTKDIDGNLSDWNVKPVAEDTTGFGQDGANLKALYVDYDDQFLYIAITTENKASWRIAYGISLDYKEGGYTGDQDSWGKKMSFKRGIDAQLYFFWNGEFFGSKGTNNITTAQLDLWNGTGWVYKDLQWTGFYAYTGGAENGLQTLEVAIPWKALGGKPKELYITAYITGQGGGDSAVDILPDDPSVHDKAPGDEWTDADTVGNFAKVVIS